MENVVTLGEIFAKAQDCLTPSFNQDKFETDVDNLSKAETENLLGTIQAEIIKGGDYDMLTEMRSIALDHITDIEKAVYADNALNRKLGRVGQEYGGKGSRGGKTDEENGGRSGSKQDKKEKVGKLTANDAAKFLSEHGEDYISYQYGDMDDDDLYDKFEAASKFIKEFKTFDWKQEDEADKYKKKMESKGYHVIDVGNGSDTIAYALIKKED